MPDDSTYDRYDNFMGRWSREVAKQFVEWIDADEALSWLDVGCGAGMLSQSVAEQSTSSKVTGIDPLENSIVAARQHPNNAGIVFEVGDAQDLPFDDDQFDIAISGLMIKFIPDKVKAIREMKRVVRPGGIVALYDWDMDSNMNTTRHFWSAVSEVAPERMEDRATDRTPMTETESLAQFFEQSGLGNIEQRTISFSTKFRDIDDYWEPITNNVQNVGKFYDTLSEIQRADVLQKWKESLPIDSDGSISFESRAVAIKGVS